MAGFGHGRFGREPFGRADWSALAVTGNMSDRMMAEDEAAEGIFAKILGMAQDGIDFPRSKVIDFPKLRDVFDVASRFTNTVNVVVVSAAARTDPDWGSYVSIVVNADFEDIGAGWKASLVAEAELTVIRVRKQERRIDVTGAVVIPAVSSTITFYAPEQVTSLYRDFGLIPDRYFDESFLRAEIAHAVQWLGLKGSNEGYVLRGKVSGYTIVIEKLYGVDPSYIGLLLSGERFEYPSGSGEYLTSVAPLFPAYDDVAADLIDTDTLCKDLTLTFPYTVSSVTASSDSPLVGTSLHLVQFSADLVEPGLVDRWQLIDSAGSVFWLESRVTDSSYYVAGKTVPVTGAASIKYICEELYDCGWCPTHYLRLVISPTAELLAAFPDSSGDATQRMLEKIEQVKPVHVVFASIVERTTVTVVAGTSVTPTSLEVDTPVAGAYQFDVPGMTDEFALDQEAGPGVTDTFT